MTDRTFKLDRLAMHQEWYEKNRTMLFLEASVVMQELLAMCRQYKAERDEARRMYCEEAFAHRFNERGGLGPITDPKQIAQGMKWDCFKETA